MAKRRQKHRAALSPYHKRRTRKILAALRRERMLVYRIATSIGKHRPFSSRVRVRYQELIHGYNRRGIISNESTNLLLGLL